MLVGRATETLLIEAAIERAAGGVATLVAIEGEAGVGKSTLVAACLERAAVAGFTPMIGRCDELESERPFGALLDALGVTDRRRPADPARQEVRDVLASAPDLASPIVMAATPDLRHRTIDSLCGLVEQEVLGRAVALVVEDLHWADPSTVLALRSIARRVEGYRLLVVVTSRPSLHHVERTALWQHATHRIALAPLPTADAIEVATRRLGAPPGPRLREVIEGAGGNPLLLNELLDGLRDVLTESRGRLDLSGAVPLGFSAGIQRRLDALSGRTAEVVQVASVLPGPLDLDDLAALLGLPVARLVPALREAVRVGLFVDEGTHVGFRHDLIRTAVLETLPGAARRMLHREAARVAIARGAAPATVAAHLEAGAATDDDTAELRTWLLRAARDAMGRSPSVAHDLLSRARATLPDDHPEAIAMAVEQLEAAVNAGLLREAVELGTVLVEGGLEHPHWVGVRWWLGGALFLSHRVAEAADLFEAAAEATPDRDTNALLLAYATMARLATFSPHVDELVARAVAAADESGDAHARTLAHGLISRTLITRLRVREGLPPARLAVAIADADPRGSAHRYQPLFFLALALFDNGHIEESRAVSWRGRRQAEALGATWAEVLFHGVDALVGYLTGQRDVAEVEAIAGLATAEETGSMIGVLWCHALLALLAVEAGDLQRAEAAIVDGEVAFASGQAQLGVELVTLARARWFAAQGRVDEALEHLAGSWEVLGLLTAEICQERIALDLVDLAMRAGDLDLAQSVASTAASWSSISPSPRVEATAAACAARIAEDPDLIDAAAAACEAIGLIADARSLRTMAAASRPGSGSEPGVVDRPSTAEISPPAAGDGWSRLTQAEQRVCLAIAEGRSNKAIAAELALSPRTVETHVTRVLRKLGLESRLQVGLHMRAQLARDAPAGSAGGQ